MLEYERRNINFKAENYQDLKCFYFMLSMGFTTEEAVVKVGEVRELAFNLAHFENPKKILDVFRRK